MKNKFDINQFVEVITPQSMAQKLAEKEKTSRKQMKLTQKELSVRSGVSYASVRRFENSGEISLFSLLKIANVLGVLEDFNALFARKAITSLKDFDV
ncbi:MAG: helix-turn-helix transcriptional regulator [Firmicutes bacterium]|nr:helix-turn-helix transcriptional regulator [Bacillota bacterium]